MSLLQKATRYAPNNAQAWFALGEIKTTFKDYYEAKSCFLNAIKFRPNDSRYYFYLGKVLIDLKNPEIAKTYLEKAVDLNPSNSEAISLLLSCLYEKSLAKSMNRKALLKQQQEVYQKLYKIDAKLASQLLESLIKQSEEAEEFPIP